MGFKSKDYGKLPIISLIASMLALIVIFAPQIIRLSSQYLFSDTSRWIFNFSFGTILGVFLPVLAIMCGSIDLSRIRKGLHKNKVFKCFDITGIVIGSIIFLFVSFFMLAEIFIPH